MILYHGTTNKFYSSIKEFGLIPGFHLMEKRKVNLNKIFYTDSIKHARGYAIRAALKFGGKPIIFICTGDFDVERKGRINQYCSNKKKVQSFISLVMPEDPIQVMVSIFNEQIR